MAKSASKSKKASPSGGRKKPAKSKKGATRTKEYSPVINWELGKKKK